MSDAIDSWCRWFALQASSIVPPYWLSPLAKELLSNPLLPIENSSSTLFVQPMFVLDESCLHPHIAYDCAILAINAALNQNHFEPWQVSNEYRLSYTASNSLRALETLPRLHNHLLAVTSILNLDRHPQVFHMKHPSTQ